MTLPRRTPILIGPYTPPPRRSRRTFLLWNSLLVAAAIVLAALIAWFFAYPGLVHQVDAIPGHVRHVLRVHHTTYTPIQNISPAMQHAIVAIEDRRFYHHHGIDLHGMARALVADVTSGHF